MLHARLHLEHAGIDEALERLIEAFATGDHEVARAAFRDFDVRLSAHLALEDEVLLPAFATVDIDEAAAIAADHRAIRAKVDELAIGSDLHLVKLPAIRRLAEDLRAHAEREDELLYPWAERHFDDSQELPTSAESPPPSTLSR